MGVIFASLIFKAFPFLAAENNEEQIQLMASIMGAEEIMRLNLKYQIVIPEGMSKIPSKKIPFEKFVNPQNEKYCSPEALNLLNKMLTFDYNK